MCGEISGAGENSVGTATAIAYVTGRRDGISTGVCVETPPKCTYSNDKPDNWRCESEKNDIHEKLKCKHYSGLRKVLKENLTSPIIDACIEWEIFNSLENNMMIEHIAHTSDDGKNTPGGKFSFASGAIRTNIEFDADGMEYMGNGIMEYRTKYQVTIHEFWHNIDYIIGKRFDNEWRNSQEYRECKDAGYPYAVMSYVFENNLLGRKIKEDISVYIRTYHNNNYSEFADELHKTRKNLNSQEAALDKKYVILMEKYKNDVNAPEQSTDNRKIFRKYLLGKNEDEEAKKYLTERDDFIHKKSEFHYLCDIFSGDFYFNNRGRLNSKRWMTRTEETWRRGGGMFFAAETFADIGCIKGANPNGIVLMKKYLRGTCEVYDTIMRSIKNKL